MHKTGKLNNWGDSLLNLKKKQLKTIFYLYRNFKRTMFFIVQLECNDLCTPNTRQEVFECEMKDWMETLMEHHLHIKDVFILEQFVRRTSKCVNDQTYEILSMLKPC